MRDTQRVPTPPSAASPLVLLVAFFGGILDDECCLEWKWYVDVRRAGAWRVKGCGRGWPRRGATDIPCSKLKLWAGQVGNSEVRVRSLLFCRATQWTREQRAFTSTASHRHHSYAASPADPKHYKVKLDPRILSKQQHNQLPLTSATAQAFQHTFIHIHLSIQQCLPRRRSLTALTALTLAPTMVYVQQSHRNCTGLTSSSHGNGLPRTIALYVLLLLDE
jgi:hypothetical protein